MRLRHLAFIFLAVGAAVMGSCSKSPQSPVAPASTETKAFVTIPKSDAYYGTNSTNFAPTSITINVGGSVTWINYDAENHQPTQDDNAWGNELSPNGQYTRTYTTAGTFPYHCELHKEMKGTVTVK
jgi:plastocyanin